MIGEYAGELISIDEWNKRDKVMKVAKTTNFFFSTCTSMVIDGYAMGNHTRFINHSCERNCKTEYAMINNCPRNFIVSMKEIKKGEEVFITYGQNYFERFGCLCGARTCFSRKWARKTVVEPEIENRWARKTVEQ